MKLKTRPEDFVVRELAEWQEDPAGEVAIYRVRKRKLTTFEAIDRIRAAVGLESGGDAISYAGLKDRQAVTLQHVGIRGRVLKGQVPGLGIELVGRSARPLETSSLRGNAFTIVVRDLGDEEASLARARALEVAELGLPNYFDDQRFSSVRRGQGFVARDLLLEDFEQALRRLIALPTDGDSPADLARKAVVRKYWGNWGEVANKVRGMRMQSLIEDLARRPGAYAAALNEMPARTRAVELLAYQAFLWNDTVARLLRAQLHPGALLESSYACGRHIFWKAPRNAVQQNILDVFGRMEVPLVSNTTRPEDEELRRVLNEVIHHEGLIWANFKMRNLPKAFFKEVQRPLLLKPTDFTVSAPEPDTEHRGKLALTLEFTLPPGSYATLVLGRIFRCGRFDDESRDPRPWHLPVEWDHRGLMIEHPLARAPHIALHTPPPPKPADPKRGGAGRGAKGGGRGRKEERPKAPRHSAPPRERREPERDARALAKSGPRPAPAAASTRRDDPKPQERPRRDEEPKRDKAPKAEKRAKSDKAEKGSKPPKGEKRPKRDKASKTAPKGDKAPPKGDKRPKGDKAPKAEKGPKPARGDAPAEAREGDSPAAAAKSAGFQGLAAKRERRARRDERRAREVAREASKQATKRRRKRKRIAKEAARREAKDQAPPAGEAPGSAEGGS